MLSFTPKLLFIAFLIALLSACGKPEHPVSWAPSVGLESQSDIENALIAPWNDAAPFIDAETGTEILVGNCVEHTKARSQGYEPLNNLVAAYVSDKAADCEVLARLSTAKPSEESYIQDFSLDAESIGKLPPQVGFIVSEERADAASKAYDAGKGLGDFDQYTVVEAYRDQAQITGEGWAMALDVLAHGDFNADGIEDLLMRGTYQATEGTYTDSRVFLLTRTTEDGRVELIEAR